MIEVDEQSKKICKKLFNDLVEVNKGDSSIKFFRKDLITMLVWMFIVKSYADKTTINIEDIARGISHTTRISKPSLRLILENAKAKGFIKFTLNKNDKRSWIIEPQDITITEFNTWSKNWFNLK
jgi:hypothetical protein